MNLVGDKDEEKKFLSVECEKCKSPLLYVTTGTTMMPPLSLCEKGDEWWICEKCSRYYMVHQQCQKNPLNEVLNDWTLTNEEIQNIKTNEFLMKSPKFCQFFGFSGWFIHPESKTLVKRFRYKQGDKIIETDSMTETQLLRMDFRHEQTGIFYLSDHDLSCLSTEGNFLIHGLSGIDPTYWKCRECNHMFEIVPPGL